MSKKIILLVCIILTGVFLQSPGVFGNTNGNEADGFSCKWVSGEWLHKRSWMLPVNGEKLEIRIKARVKVGPKNPPGEVRGENFVYIDGLVVISRGNGSFLLVFL